MAYPSMRPALNLDCCGGQVTIFYLPKEAGYFLANCLLGLGFQKESSGTRKENRPWLFLHQGIKHRKLFMGGFKKINNSINNNTLSL